MRWLKTTGGLLCMMLLMASCIRIDANIKVEDDGSGSVEFLSALNVDALTSVLGDFDVPESEIGDTAQLCDEFESDTTVTADLPNGATFTPYEEDGFCGTVVQYDFGPSSDASAQIQSVLEDPAARLYQEGDNWFFETSINTDDLTSEADDAPQAMLDALFADASYTITVDLPGRAVEGEHNATTVGDDGMFTWEIDILNPPAQLFAQTEPGSGGGSGGGGISALLIGLIVLALAAVAGFFLWKRNNDAGSPDALTPDAMTPDQMAAGIQQPGLQQPPMDTGAVMAAPAATGMPVVNGPAITATPPGAAVTPGSHAADETVVMNAADVQQSIQDSVADTNAAPSMEPVFDPELNAWVVDDPSRGRLRHDPATDTWSPV